MDKISNFGKSVSSSFTPWAQRTQQWTKEQFGQVDPNEKTELPPDYLELEKRVDALKQAHQKLLNVTSQYTNEAYDYPPNLRESFNDLGRTISEKVNLLSTASSPAEASAALTAPPSAKPQPKTFNHAIARAALASSQLLHQGNTSSTKDDPLAEALEKYAIAEEKVGEARLEQDAAIQAKFLAGWSTTLNTSLNFATKARKQVDSARLALDASKANAKAKSVGATEGDVGSPSIEKARTEMEKREDEFVAQTEEAEGVMKNVLDTPEPLRNLSELIAAQMEYHKHAYEILSELSPVIERLQEDQETEYRKARETALDGASISSIADDDDDDFDDITLHHVHGCLARHYLLTGGEEQGTLSTRTLTYNLILKPLPPLPLGHDGSLDKTWSIGKAASSDSWTSSETEVDSPTLASPEEFALFEGASDVSSSPVRDVEDVDEPRDTPGLPLRIKVTEH